MKNFEIIDSTIDQSNGEIAAYNAIAAYAKSITCLRSEPSLRMFVNMVPGPKVWTDHINNHNKEQAALAEAQRAQAEAQKAKEAANQEVIIPEVIENV